METENIVIPPRRTKANVGGCAYAMAGTSFIPYLGVLSGIVSIIVGLTTKRGGRRLLIALGSLGILFTVAIHQLGSYVYGVIARKGAENGGLEVMSLHALYNLQREIEVYKLLHGTYPDRLEDIGQKSEKAMVLIADPIFMFGDRSNIRMFHYESINEGYNYRLFSVGRDGVPDTEDDIHPTFVRDSGMTSGYMFSVSNEKASGTEPHISAGERR